MATLHILGIFLGGVGLLLFAVGFLWWVSIQSEKEYKND